MRLSEIQNKDVINLTTGMKIGNIIDVKINKLLDKSISDMNLSDMLFQYRMD